MRTTFLDYDTRREPKTARYCVKCQRDIAPTARARVVRVLDAMVLHPDDAGSAGEDFLVGLDCAKQLGLEFSRPEQEGQRAEVLLPGKGVAGIAPRLTVAQSRVMQWLSRGWTAEPGVGSAVIVNGSRICNVDTMQALYRAGFATPDSLGCWRATPAGLGLSDRLTQPK